MKKEIEKHENRLWEFLIQKGKEVEKNSLPLSVSKKSIRKFEFFILCKIKRLPPVKGAVLRSKTEGLFEIFDIHSVKIKDFDKSRCRSAASLPPLAQGRLFFVQLFYVSSEFIVRTQ